MIGSVEHDIAPQQRHPGDENPESQELDERALPWSDGLPEPTVLQS